MAFTGGPIVARFCMLTLTGISITVILLLHIEQLINDDSINFNIPIYYAVLYLVSSLYSGCWSRGVYAVLTGIRIVYTLCPILRSERQWHFKSKFSSVDATCNGNVNVKTQKK